MFFLKEINSKISTTIMKELINNEKVLNQFKHAEVKKSEIESKVYEFKKDLNHILQ